MAWANMQPLRVIAARMTVLAVVLATAAVSACGGSTTGVVSHSQVPTLTKGTVAASPTQTPASGHPLPAFSDWRAAYLGSDGLLHAVTLDGKVNVAGPILPGFSRTGLPAISTGFSPDGHWLAYEADDFEVLDLTGQHAPEGIPDCCGSQSTFWSPDSTQLASGDNVGDLGLFLLAQNKNVPLLGSQALGIGALVGWLDNAHLAVTLLTFSADRSTIQSVTIGSYSIASRTVRDIATVRSDALGIPYVSLAPDGSKALIYNRQYRDYPYVPLVDEIDIATGAIMPRPQIAKVMGPYSGFTSVAWRHGNNLVAASAGYKENGDLSTWVLNLQSDAVLAAVTPAGFVGGWVPDGSALVLTSGEQAGIGVGPFTLTAVVVSADGHVSTTPLTTDAMSFPFLGFVRTA